MRKYLTIFFFLFVYRFIMYLYICHVLSLINIITLPLIEMKFDISLKAHNLYILNEWCEIRVRHRIQNFLFIIGTVVCLCICLFTPDSSFHLHVMRTEVCRDSCLFGFDSALMCMYAFDSKVFKTKVKKVVHLINNIIDGS